MEVVKSKSKSKLLGTLRSYASGAYTSPETIEEEVAKLLEEKLQQPSSSNSSAVPFFLKPKRKTNGLSSLIQKQARTRKEQAKQEAILDEAQLRQILYLLEEYAVHDGDDVRINYDGFSQVATRCREIYGPQTDAYFKASVFKMFKQDGNGCISANHFASYLSMRSSMYHMRVHLGMFDVNNTGVLSEEQLEEFLVAMMPELPTLEDMEPSFVQNYRRIAARKIMLYHGRNASVTIKDLVNSMLMQELMDLKIAGQTENQLMMNWFSQQSTRRVYNTFRTLDEDMNGMLSRSEFSQISNGTMSQLFIKRIFEEHVQRRRVLLGRSATGVRDEMDLVSFTDFVLAWDHRSQPAAIKYFFDIFDLDKKGHLSPNDLYVFFREIHWMWVNVMNEYADLAIADVVDEIIDMVNPNRKPFITVEDLQASKMSGIFFSILSDVKQFYDYNYRENLMHQDDDQ